MRFLATGAVVAAVLCLALPVRAVSTSLDTGWKFTRSDPKDGASPTLDDSSWASVDVPHDWSIAGPFAKDAPAGGAGAFLPTGVAWYRHRLPAFPQDKRVSVDFDGLQANPVIYLNGQEIYRRPFGYFPIHVDLTPHLNPAGENVLAVRTDTSKQPASRWYAGSGINRHVRLTVCDPLHLEHDSTFVMTPKIEPKSATVHVRTTVVNDSSVAREFTVVATVHGPGGSAPDGGYAATGKSAVQSLAPRKSVTVEVDVPLAWAPRLWDLDHPDLHTARVRVMAGNDAVDDAVVPFGIRTAEFRPDTGFWLNGKNFKLKGVCIHEEASALGTAVPISAWERRLATLKALGVNAIRTAHNPFSSDFLSLCDRMGFVVMDEFFDCWTVGKNPYDYHLYFKDWAIKDLVTTVRRDRNHPSIVLYSAGNEIHDTPHPDVAIPILKSLVEAFHENDPTRPVTQALFRPNVSHDYEDGLADLLDVVGTNYRDTELLAAHAAKPSRKIVVTEAGHDRKNWVNCRDNPPLAGQFLWTGIDYLGEAGRWPTVAASSGLLDRTGAVKPMGYERASWWTDSPMVFTCRRVAPAGRGPVDPGFETVNRRPSQFGDWTPKDTSPHEETVEVYSNCDTVELFLNDKSLGTKPLNKDASPRTWTVAFEPGTLSVRASNGGTVVAAHELRTAGKAARIFLSAERKELPVGWDNVAYVTATVVDDHGVPVPSAADEVSFSVAGPAVVVATDSADNASHEAFGSSKRRAYQSRCVAIVRATADSGAITVTATAAGLEPGTVSLSAVAAK